MKVGDLRERLAAFGDQDAQVLIGLDPREWSHVTYTTQANVDLGRTSERVFFIGVSEMPVEQAEECSRCDRLQDAIDEAMRALESA